MPKILVIEDMPDSAEMTAQILRRYDHEVWVAPNGEQGLSMAAGHMPDLIICDYWLPDLDARSFLSRLRKMKSLKDTKVIICTATPKEAMDQALDSLEIDAYILKPFRLSAFMETIEKHLN